VEVPFHSIGSGASGLPSYCTPHVCVPALIGGLAVWRHNKAKTKNQKPPGVLADRSPPSSWLSFPPLVAAVSISPKDAEMPGSGRIGVIGALVFFLI